MMSEATQPVGFTASSAGESDAALPDSAIECPQNGQPVEVDAVETSSSGDAEPIDLTEVPACEAPCRPAPTRSAVAALLLPFSMSVLLHAATAAIALAVIWWTPHVLHLSLFDPGDKNGDAASGDDVPIGALIDTGEPPAPSPGSGNATPVQASASAPPPAMPAPLEGAESSSTDAVVSPPPELPEPQVQEQAEAQLKVEPTTDIAVLPKFAKSAPPIPQTQPTVAATQPTSPMQVAGASPAAQPAAPAVTNVAQGAASEGASEQAASGSGMASAQSDLPIEQRPGYLPPRPAGRGGSGRRYGRGTDERGLPMPEYPSESKRRGEYGLVVLQLDILENGSVGGVNVVRSSGHARLDKAATAAAERADLTSATLNGKPVRGRLVVPFRFVLQ